MRQNSLLMFLLLAMAVAMFSGCDRNCDCACDETCIRPAQTPPPKPAAPAAPAAVEPPEKKQSVNKDLDDLRLEIQKLREELSKQNDVVSTDLTPLAHASEAGSNRKTPGLLSIWYAEVEKEKKAVLFEDSIDKVLAPLEKSAPKK